MRPYLDKAAPEAWKAAGAYSQAIAKAAADGGLLPTEGELIKIRASQLNGCAFCLDLHTREAREAGVPQQQIDLLPAWRETTLFSERERAALAVAEAATQLPLSEEAQADLFGARTVLGDDAFVAAEWVAATINLFNRISILSEHPVRPRKA
ncbi:carboxymuconolactone decarboxylase family protein [Leucobacter sp. BZR 635]